jgi:hypothetical protein
MDLTMAGSHFEPGTLGTLYFDANSIGPMPRSAPLKMQSVLHQGWAEARRRSWNMFDWLEQPRKLGASIAHLIGAGKEDVRVTDTTSINQYKLLRYALSIAAPRRVIVLERDVFPSNLYVAEAIAQAKRAGPLKTLGLIVGITAVFLAFSYGVQSIKRGDPPERTPDRVEAELRYGAYLAAQRVDQYIGVVGRLPSGNADIGYGEGWLTYTKGTEGNWVITAREGDITVTLRSDDDRRSWLGDAGKRVVSGK